jgi:hypothetical protein
VLIVGGKFFQRFAVARATCGAKFKVRGEAKAGDDHAGTDAGSRPC